MERHLIKIVKFYLIWSTIYLPLAIYGYHTDGDGMVRAIALYVRNLFFQGDHYFSWPLWYLLSSIYAFMILYVLLKKKKANTVPLIGFIILFIFLGEISDIFVINMDSLFGIVEVIAKVLQKTFGKGRIFTGVYFVLIGVLIARYKEWLSSISNAVLVTAFTVCFFSVALFNIPLANIVMHGLLFVIVEKLAWKRMNGAYLRRCSTVIYYTHMLFFFVYTLYVADENRYGIVGFLVTAVCALMLAVVVSSEKIRNNKVDIMLFGKM